MDQNLPKLNSDILATNLGALQKPSIIPKSSKIAHFGIGVFHRAHQQLYTQLAIDKIQSDCWGITGVGIMPFDKKLVEIMNEQNCLYTLTEKSFDGTQTSRIIGTLKEYIYGPDNLQKVTETLAAETMEVITMTITQGGYFIKKDTGQFDITNQKIVNQISNWNNEAPSTIYGYLTRVLDRRMKTHGKGITILSCDNIQHNGDFLAKGFLSFLIKAHPDLLNWAKQKCTFPNSMVDRITPQSSQKDIDYIAQKYKIQDLAPVISESFTQWIIEDKFAFERPPWEISGAQFVQDVTPYEKMKLRILNGSHQALCYIGTLVGYKYVHEAAQDKTIRQFIDKYLKEEVLETLDPVPGINLAVYCHQVMQRFGNQAILDTLSRICEFTSDRIPLFNVPSMLDMKKMKKPLQKSAMIVATWIIFIYEYIQGNKFAVVDNRKEQILSAVEQIKKGKQVQSFLALPGMFGTLKDDKQFCQHLKKSYERLLTKQYLTSLQELL